VTTLADGYRPAGNHSVTWDGRNGRGEPVASGVYFYRIEADDFVKTKKMLLLK
jgi:flagellar hook assembly protein FlgD